MDGGGRFPETLNGPSGPAGAARREAAAGRPKGASAYADMPRRRRAAPAWLRRLKPSPAVLLGATLVANGAALSYAGWRISADEAFRDQVIAALDPLLVSAGLEVRTMDVNGETAIPDLDVLEALMGGGVRALPFYDAQAARERLRQIPWVADATVRKVYPDALAVELSRREPFAIWQRGGEVVVIDRTGHVLQQSYDDRYAGLPLVVGVGAERLAEEIVNTLSAYPAIAAQTAAAVRVADRRWNLRMSNGVDVRLPEHGIDRALSELTRIDEEQRILERAVAHIDMRLPDRLTVRLPVEAAEARRAELDNARKNSKKAGAKT